MYYILQSIKNCIFINMVFSILREWEWVSCLILLVIKSCLNVLQYSCCVVNEYSCTHIAIWVLLYLYSSVIFEHLSTIVLIWPNTWILYVYNIYTLFKHWRLKHRMHVRTGWVWVFNKCVSVKERNLILQCPVYEDMNNGPMKMTSLSHAITLTWPTPQSPYHHDIPCSRSFKSSPKSKGHHSQFTSGFIECRVLSFSNQLVLRGAYL